MEAHPTPLEIDDDALAERLADLCVELASQPGPHRLRVLQAAGLIPQPGEISQTQIAQCLGCSRTRVQQLEAHGLTKARHQIRP